MPLVPLLLLVMARLPVAAPTRVGSNFTLKVVDCPGFSVTGKVAPDTVKPVPFSVGALIVKAKLPVDANVRDCVAAVFTSTLPNDTLAALVLRAAESIEHDGFMKSEQGLHCLPPFLADFLADFLAARSAPRRSFSCNALARLTLSPPLGAAAVSVTVQASSTHPVVDVVVQVSVFNADVLAPNKARGKMLDNNISRPVRQWLRPHIWVRR